MMHRDDATGALIFPPEPTSRPCAMAGEPAENLRHLYFALAKVLPQVWVKPLNVLAYLQSE